MKRRVRSFLLAAISILGPFVGPSGVSAGGSSGDTWNRLSGGAWYFGSAAPEQATAFFRLAYWDDTCLDIELEGSERQFQVLVSPVVQRQLGALQSDDVTWQDLLNCLPDGIPYPTDQEFWMIEGAVWEKVAQTPSNGEGLWARTFPCLDVSARETKNRNVEAIVALAGANDYSEVPGLDIWQSEDVWDTYPIGSARFFDISLVLFAVGLEGQIDLGEKSLSWTFDINIRECGYSGPDIDIEHYRRMAEEAPALPDTR